LEVTGDTSDGDRQASVTTTDDTAVSTCSTLPFMRAKAQRSSSTLACAATYVDKILKARSRLIFPLCFLPAGWEGNTGAGSMSRCAGLLYWRDLNPADFIPCGIPLQPETTMNDQTRSEKKAENVSMWERAVSVDLKTEIRISN
jgi:hypothetical protein